MIGLPIAALGLHGVFLRKLPKPLAPMGKSGGFTAQINGFAFCLLGHGEG